MEQEFDLNLFEYMNPNNILSSEEIEYLKEHNTLVYGADYNSPPLRYVNPTSKQYEGLVIDYLRALSIELGINLEFKPLIWNDALVQLSEGTTDLCDMYKSKERAKTFLFSTPIYYQRGVILTNKSNIAINSQADLEGKTIAGSKGDYIFEFINNNFSNVITIETSDLQEAIELLKLGQIDAVLGDESVINYFITKDGLSNEMNILDEPLYEREAVLAVSKENEQLLNILNKGVNGLNKKKTMQKIYQKWFGISPLIIKNNSTEKYTFIIKTTIIVVTLAALFLYIWNLQLKREVTKRTNELYLSKNALETTFDGLTHLMAVVDEDCQITNANKAFCINVNLTEKSLLNSHCKDINDILGTDCSKCLIHESFAENKSIIKEVKHENKTYKVNTFILDQLPQTKRRVLVMMEDITLFKVNEQQMLQSSKMAAIGQLAAGVAHEIRNPIGIIRNYCFLLKQSLLNPEDAESINTIESSVDRANSIITNLLNFSRLTDNTVSYTNIHSLLNTILDLSKKTSKTHHVTCTLECKNDLNININSESLKHIMLNLISNSVDAMAFGGAITISVTDSNDHLTILISDTGAGIKDEHLDNIFNPFFTTKEPGSGTGLGLYIAYNEVQKLHGTITVHSTLDVGTTFAITIPKNTHNL